MHNSTIDNKNETPKRQRYGREANRMHKAGLVTSSEVGVVEIESVFSGGAALKETRLVLVSA